MNSSPDAPILINSDEDEDDSDVEFIHEEKNEDLDVIFVSQSTTSTLVTPKCDEQHTGCGHVVPTVPSVSNRSMSISSSLDVTLTIEDRDLNSPLDLSSKKGPSDFSDISEPSDDSDDDDSSAIDDLDTDGGDVIQSLVSGTSKGVDRGDLACRLNSGSSGDNLMAPLQDNSLTSNGVSSMDVMDSSDVSMAVVSSSDTNISSAGQGCVLSVPSPHVTDMDIKPHIPHFKTEKLDSFIHVAVKPKDGVLPKVAPVLSRPKDLQSSSKCKEEETSSGDIWDTLKKDLDFLNNTPSCPSAHSSLSYPGGSGSGTLSISKILDPTHPPSKCMNTSTQSSNNFSISSILNSSASTDSTLRLSQGHVKDKANASHLSSTPKSDTSPSTSMSMDDLTYNSSINKQLPPKKQQRCMRQFSCPTLRKGGTSPAGPSSKSQSSCFGWEKCSYCQVSLLGLKSSRCLQGHVTCGMCLEEKVKLVLTGKTKESLRCVQSGCDSYYPMSELKQSLPNIVVEILEDKLDNDYIDYIANMILKNAGASSPPSSNPAPSSSSSTLSISSSASASSSSSLSSATSLASALMAPVTMMDDSQGTSTSQPAKGPEVKDIGESVKPETPTENKEPMIEGCPPNWTQMDKRSSYFMVPLEPESQEYVDVALKFHNSMKFPAADITKIFRVQNPILWKYYTVKRTEMIIENDGLDVQENSLFHGTTSSVLDAICKKGFDWRVCGKNATVYGQGSYFAVNASYSHMYTDNGNENRRRGRVVTLMSGMPRRMPAHVPYLSTPPASNVLPTQIGFGPSAIHVYPPPTSISSIPAGGASNNPLPNISTPSTPSSSSHMVAQGLAAPTPSDKGSNNSSQAPPPPQAAASSAQPAPGPVRNRHITHQLTTIRRQLNVLRSSVQHWRNTSIPTQIGQPSLGNPADLQSSNKTVHRMFLAKVLVGKYTGGHSGLRKPPPLYPCTDPYGKCYDSCVDNIHNPKIFVIFDTAQAYPSYVLEYHCEDG
ncbi:serine-rich adhesin for platelets-like isoform X1 [Argopecten irradians]|uniref:serine-rich adhesin for platelets-like isoform X1 n=1 Tax=Argopecten irradians TaxID=31199 RepID=UPI00371DAE55